MILVRHLSTTLAESLIHLSDIPSGPVALFALSVCYLTILNTSEAGDTTYPHPKL